MSSKLNTAIYTNHIGLYSLIQSEKINNGEYPIHLGYVQSELLNLL